MAESILVNGATVLAGAASAVEAYLIPVAPELDFRVECSEVHTINFWVANADFSAVSAASELAGTEEATVPATTGTGGNVYRIDAGSYDYVAAVVTNDGAVPATVTIAAGYDLVAEAPSALFTVAEARAFTARGTTPLSDTVTYPNAAIIAAEAAIREGFEDAVGVALIPTSETITLDGCYSRSLRLPVKNPAIEIPRRALTVTAASIDGVALTVTELAAVKAHGDGRLVRTDGGTWSSGTGYQDLAVSVTVTHGWATVPHRIHDAALLLAVRMLVGSDVPEEAVSFSDGGASYQFPRAGRAPHWYGYDAVDAVLASFQENRVVIA